MRAASRADHAELDWLAILVTHSSQSRLGQNESSNYVHTAYGLHFVCLAFSVHRCTRAAYRRDCTAPQSLWNVEMLRHDLLARLDPPGVGKSRTKVTSFALLADPGPACSINQRTQKVPSVIIVAEYVDVEEDTVATATFGGPDQRKSSSVVSTIPS
jgi:hypothetical protein